MSDYLKDKSIPFLTIQGDDLDALNSDMEKIRDDARLSDNTIHLYYIIRYDGIGIVRKNYYEIKKCFDIAKKIERIIINLKNEKSYNLKGKNIEIKLDSADVNNCSLTVHDDDESWVEKNFKSLSSRLDKFSNKNSLVHSSMTTLVIQLLGVLSGLFLSLIFAKLLVPWVQIPYSFLILFIGIFLVFSNLWTYILGNLNIIRVKIWPFVCFNKKPLGIVWQAIIGLIVTSIVISLGSWSLNILKNAGEIITK